MAGEGPSRLYFLEVPLKMLTCPRMEHRPCPFCPPPARSQNLRASTYQNIYCLTQTPSILAPELLFWSSLHLTPTWSAPTWRSSLLTPRRPVQPCLSLKSAQGLVVLLPGIQDSGFLSQEFAAQGHARCPGREGGLELLRSTKWPPAHLP